MEPARRVAEPAPVVAEEEPGERRLEEVGLKSVRRWSRSGTVSCQGSGTRGGTAGAVTMHVQQSTRASRPRKKKNSLHASV